MLGRLVVPVAVYVATGMPGPGHVRHYGRGDVVMGPFPRSDAVAALCLQDPRVIKVQVGSAKLDVYPDARVGCEVVRRR